MARPGVVLEIPNPLIVLVVVAVLIAVWVVLIFNRLVRDRNLVGEAWSGIDVQLKRRHNLIPALVETVKGYSRHEDKVLTDVTRVRSESIEASGVKKREASENALSQALRGLFAVAEAYPDLKADRVYRELQGQLVEVEDDLQMSRRYYNGTVREFNIRAEKLPNALVAGILGFRAADFFELESAVAAEAPKVEV